jgi:hypothetical protein
MARVVFFRQAERGLFCDQRGTGGRLDGLIHRLYRVFNWARARRYVVR